jgi:hypothetical protein
VVQGGRAAVALVALGRNAEAGRHGVELVVIIRQQV